MGIEGESGRAKLMEVDEGGKGGQKYSKIVVVSCQGSP